MLTNKDKIYLIESVLQNLEEGGTLLRIARAAAPTLRKVYNVGIDKALGAGITGIGGGVAGYLSSLFNKSEQNDNVNNDTNLQSPPPQPRRFRLIGNWNTPPETPPSQPRRFRLIGNWTTPPQQPNSTTTANLQKTPMDKRVYKT